MNKVYIEKKPLLEEINDVISNISFTSPYQDDISLMVEGMERIRDMVEEAPPAEVAPMKYGEIFEGLAKLDPYIVDGTVMFELGSYIDFLKQMGAKTGTALNEHYEIGTKSRCHKCINEMQCSKDKDNERNCPDYKRDPKDGGFYG